MAYYHPPKVTTSIGYATRPAKRPEKELKVLEDKPKYSPYRPIESRIKKPPIFVDDNLKEQQMRRSVKFAYITYKYLCGPQPNQRNNYSQQEIAERLENGR